MGHLVTLAACCLDQWALDFKGNLERILESIRLAKETGARFRFGPELEISGYACSDHFLESDTYLHSWEAVAKLLEAPIAKDMLVDVGMPVTHKGVKYNCRLSFLNKKILLIRPKLFLANDGNYQEARWFTAWVKRRTIEDHYLPESIAAITGQSTVPFGDAVLSALDTTLGSETCEELFTPASPHIDMFLDGVEIIYNGSASHHEFRKLNTRVELIQSATQRSGGVYLYSNLQGCDGDRVYFDGCPLISFNGKVVGQGSQFSLRDVEVVTATVDLEDIRSKRGSQFSRGVQSAAAPAYPRIEVNIALSRDHDGKFAPRKPLLAPKYHTPEEEICLGPACWLWDYLRRSKQSGFFLPLSGGMDSCATALMVYSMCDLVCTAIANGDTRVLLDAQTITGTTGTDYTPTSPKELCGRIFHTAFIGTDHSTNETRQRAKNLAEFIGSYHLDFDMDKAVACLLGIFTLVTGKTPHFRKHGGTDVENLAMQNVQARLRMVLSYLFAQLLLWFRGRGGGLLVLGSSNVDESLRGYLTKYDCSSADLNPIGGISKLDLGAFIEYCQTRFSMPFLADFLSATPTAELEPMSPTQPQQSDEKDMGMSYRELSRFGSLRKVYRCGPFSMFTKLVYEWQAEMSVLEIAAKVKSFFYYYSLNRHKSTTLPPSYHMSPYSQDANRYDIRPFLYNLGWEWQFSAIDELAVRLQAMEKVKGVIARSVEGKKKPDGVSVVQSIKGKKKGEGKEGARVNAANNDTLR